MLNIPPYQKQNNYRKLDAFSPRHSSFLCLFKNLGRGKWKSIPLCENVIRKKHDGKEKFANGLKMRWGQEREQEVWFKQFKKTHPHAKSCPSVGQVGGNRLPGAPCSYWDITLWEVSSIYLHSVRSDSLSDPAGLLMECSSKSILSYVCLPLRRHNTGAKMSTRHLCGAIAWGIQGEAKKNSGSNSRKSSFPPISPATIPVEMGADCNRCPPTWKRQKTVGRLVALSPSQRKQREDGYKQPGRGGGRMGAGKNWLTLTYMGGNWWWEA